MQRIAQDTRDDTVIVIGRVAWIRPSAIRLDMIGLIDERIGTAMIIEHGPACRP